ncbi:hypothetical protein [Fibrella forsythiae]|uniref:Uncharacterized protein n=1 Tax=Fibrella forsythiae TaxID=2817061 RepID=A0ABS3JTL5_9BACT|nr:hypothetical protein [Fibrella forsythiae]MBO0953288.1 hypothetical protein [Fibrella forsythiae]
MTSPICPYVEAVDPNLQSVASESLHWLHLDEHTCELHRQTQEPQLDGFGKPVTQLLGLIKYDPDTELYLGYVHPWTEPGKQPPLLPVLARYHKLLVQNKLIEFLHSTSRL